MFLRRLAIGAVGLMLAMTGMNRAADAPAGKVMESKLAQEQVRTVQFASELGLDVPALATLADRIDVAVAQSDPVALALAAKELGAYEKVAGKTARVKSADLASTAATLAALRFQPTELKVVAELMPDEKMTKSVKAVLEKATKAEAAAKAALASGEKARGIAGKLRVVNRTAQYVHVFVNARSVGDVAPNGSEEVFVGDSPWATTYLDARNSTGGTWHEEISTPEKDMTWVLNGSGK